MLSSKDIIEVIDSLLYAIEIQNKGWPPTLRTSMLCGNLPPHQVKDILVNLINKKIIYEPKALGTSKDWRYAITDPLKDHQIVFDINLEEIENYKKSLTLGQSRQHVIAKNGCNKIEKIACIKSKNEEESWKIVINGNLENTLEINKHAGCWKMLFEVAESKSVENDKKNKSHYDYFNFRPDCLLYSQGKYTVTKILKIVDSQIMPAIEINFETQKSYKTKLNKQLR